MSPPVSRNPLSKTQSAKFVCLLKDVQALIPCLYRLNCRFSGRLRLLYAHAVGAMTGLLMKSLEYT